MIKIKQVLGKFKDEENGNIISEVICLKPKMYAIKTEEGLHKKLKGFPNWKLIKNYHLRNRKAHLMRPTERELNMFQSNQTDMKYAL